MRNDLDQYKNAQLKPGDCTRLIVILDGTYGYGREDITITAIDIVNSKYLWQAKQNRRHLANMISGYGIKENPNQIWQARILKKESTK